MDERPAPPPGTRLVVAVAGAGPGCGTTTVARGLACALAARDVAGSAVVAGPVGRSVPPIALPAATRLARSAERVGGGRARAAGRVCLIEHADPVALAVGLRHTAPLVLDVSLAAEAAAIASLADCVVLVATPKVEPALASVVASSLARSGPQPLLVLNRAPPGAEPARWSALLPDSRSAARAALAGCAAPGRLTRALGALAAGTGVGLDA